MFCKKVPSRRLTCEQGISCVPCAVHHVTSYKWERSDHNLAVLAVHCAFKHCIAKLNLGNLQKHLKMHEYESDSVYYRYEVERCKKCGYFILPGEDHTLSAYIMMNKCMLDSMVLTLFDARPEACRTCVLIGDVYGNTIELVKNAYAPTAGNIAGPEFTVRDVMELAEDKIRAVTVRGEDGLWIRVIAHSLKNVPLPLSTTIYRFISGSTRPKVYYFSELPHEKLRVSNQRQNPVCDRDCVVLAVEKSNTVGDLLEKRKKYMTMDLGVVFAEKESNMILEFMHTGSHYIQ